MNRYITDGILRDLADGKNVSVVAPTLRQSENEMHLAIEAEPDDWERISRANGNKYAAHIGGGTLRPIAASASLRGVQADVLLVFDLHYMSERQQQEIIAASRASTEVLLNS